MRKSVATVALLGATVAVLLGGAQGCQDDRGGTQPPKHTNPTVAASPTKEVIVRTETFDTAGNRAARFLQLIISCFQADGRLAINEEGARAPLIRNEKTPNAFHVRLTPGVVTCSMTATYLGKKNEQVMIYLVYGSTEVPHSRHIGKITVAGPNGNGATHVTTFFNVPI